MNLTTADILNLPPGNSLRKALEAENAKRFTKPAILNEPSQLEAKFLTTWNSMAGPSLVREHRFHPERRWRFDFAHLASRTAIEIEGAIWSGGRHSRGSGYAADCEKYNAAIILGWRVFRLTSEQLKTHIEVSEIIKFTLKNERNI